MSEILFCTLSTYLNVQPSAKGIQYLFVHPRLLSIHVLMALLLKGFFSRASGDGSRLFMARDFKNRSTGCRTPTAEVSCSRRSLKFLASLSPIPLQVHLLCFCTVTLSHALICTQVTL